jgi:uncharacterized protein (TIGR02679 family)
VVSTWPSLRSAGLDALWATASGRLERSGTGSRGRVRTPVLDAGDRLALGSLLGRRPTATVDLADLEAALRRLGVGDDLVIALDRLGHPVSELPARRRAERRAADAGREAARRAAAGWPEAWAVGWIDETARAGGLRGLNADSATRLVAQVRAVLDRLGQPADREQQSRTEVAAKVLGSAHALDDGTLVEAAVTRALAHRFGPATTRELWERAGAPLDLVSGPVLTWALPLLPPGAAADLAGRATSAGVPLHLSQMALRQADLHVAAGADILVVENPRLVEAAAQRRTGSPVVATNGNPSSAVDLLLRRLLAVGAHLRYHGDFDTAGLGICGRMAQMGLVPWRMGQADYRHALQRAADQEVELPVEDRAPPATPWDPGLRDLFDRRRLIVHEERLLDELLAP